MNDELLIKFLLNETTLEEGAEVRAWMAAAAENEKYYKQFEQIWNESAELTQTSVINTEQAWRQFKERTDQKVQPPIVKKLSAKIIWMRVAAAFLLCFGAWLAYQQLGNPYTDLQTTDFVLRQPLPDGSQLVLNKHTDISYARNFKTNRRIALNHGEVFFDVAPDKVHPFIIDIDQVQVEVVGTSFNIKKIKNGVEVIVENGMVKVRRGDQELTLQKGESIFLSDEKELVKQPTEDELYNYYRTGIFVANNTSLTKLANTLTEAYGVKIVVSEEAQQDSIVTTLPLKYSLEKNLQRVCETLDLKMQRNQNEILLSKK